MIKCILHFGFHEDEDLNEDEACEETNDSDAVMKARTNSMKAVTTYHASRVSFDLPRRSKETLLARYNHRVNKMNKGHPLIFSLEQDRGMEGRRGPIIDCRFKKQVT